MELFKKILFHLFMFTILGSIYFVAIAGYYGWGLLSIIYFVIIYALVVLFYYYVNRKTKNLIKRRNKIIMIILTTITLTVVFGTISGTVDYIRTKNGNLPIFSLTSYGYSKHEAFLDGDEDSSYSGLQYNATEYYGLGYKLVVCDSCEKSVYFMPFGIGTYAWFIGMPVDKLDGRWFHAHSNDIYLSFDGVGYYALLTNDKIIEEGTYKLDEGSVTLNPKNSDNIGTCTIKNNYHELHCDNYTDVFMK